MIELKDLEHVAMIKRAGGVQKAATVLGLSQPALSKRLQNLEARIGLRLFDRQSKGVKLTEAGKLFVAEGERLLAHSRDFSTKLSDYRTGKSGIVSIGIKPGMDEAFFRRSLIEFLEKFPETDVDIVVGATPTLASEVTSGGLDFAIGAMGYSYRDGSEIVMDDQLEFIPKFRIPIEIFVRKDHPVLNSPNGIEDIFHYPMICPTPPAKIWESIQKEYSKRGFAVERPQIVVDDYSFVYDIVERTDFWSGTFLSGNARTKLQDRFVILGATPAIEPLTVGLIKRRTWSFTPAAQNLLEVIFKHAGQWII